jgi:ATP dependent DNA ligase-like protein
LTGGHGVGNGVPADAGELKLVRIGVAHTSPVPTAAFLMRLRLDSSTAPPRPRLQSELVDGPMEGAWYRWWLRLTTETMCAVLPVLEPMLASTGPIAAPATDWAFEPKLDGWRVLIYIDGGLRVRSRNGHDITTAVPELAPLAEELAGRSMVLDGELVARQGRPWDFYGLGARLGARSSVAAARGRARTPVTFAAFDVLVLDGEVVTRLPWVERRALLDGIGFQGPAWCTVSSFAGMGTPLLRADARQALDTVVRLLWQPLVVDVPLGRG